MPVTVQLKVPAPPVGYEYTGEFRHPYKGSFYFEDGIFKPFVDGLFFERLLIRKKKPWRAAHGSIYFFVNPSGTVEPATDYYYDFDKKKVGVW